jgi:hypothetical protein
MTTTIKVTLTKHRATWYWTALNDVGGSFGSNHCGAKKVALARAARGVQPGATFELVTNEKSEGLFTVDAAGAVVRAS